MGLGKLETCSGLFVMFVCFVSARFFPAVVFSGGFYGHFSAHSYGTEKLMVHRLLKVRFFFRPMRMYITIVCVFCLFVLFLPFFSAVIFSGRFCGYFSVHSYETEKVMVHRL